MQHLYLIDHIMNITFLLFLSLLLYFLYRKAMKRKLWMVKQEVINDEVFLFFDYYRIKNIYYSLFRTFLYIILNILIFFLIRLLRINNKIDLTNINPIFIISIINMVYILLITFIFFYYIKFVKEWLFPDVIRLYLYFYSEQNFFTDVIFRLNCQRYYFMKFFEYIHSSLRYCINKEDRKEWDDLMHSFPRLRFKITQQFYNKMKNYPRILSAISSIDIYIMSKIALHIWYINVALKDLFILCLGVVLIYDLIHKQLFYIYYALVIFMLINLYSRIIKFAYNIEIGDISLGQYLYKGFYKKPITPEEFTKIEEKANRNEKLTEDEINSARMRAKMIEHIPYVEDWADYLLNDLKNIHVRLNGDRNEYPYIVWPVRRIILLVCSILCLIYVLYYRNISISLGDFTINKHFLFLIILYSIGKLWYITGYSYLKKYINYGKRTRWRTYGQKKYHRLFWILNIGVMVLALAIFLHINFFSLMNDNITFYNIINITLSYTVEEKISFMQYYLQQLYPLVIRHTTLSAPKTLSLDYLLTIVSQIDYMTLISSETSISLIKNYCEGLVTTYFTQEKYLEDLLQKRYMDDIYENSVSHQMKNFIAVLLATLSMGYTAQYYNNLYHLIFQIGTTTFTRKILENIFINAVNICKGDKKKAWVLIKYIIEYLAHGKKK